MRCCSDEVCVYIYWWGVGESSKCARALARGGTDCGMGTIPLCPRPTKGELASYHAATELLRDACIRVPAAGLSVLARAGVVCPLRPLRLILLVRLYFAAAARFRGAGCLRAHGACGQTAAARPADPPAAACTRLLGGGGQRAPPPPRRSRRRLSGPTPAARCRRGARTWSPAGRAQRRAMTPRRAALRPARPSAPAGAAGRRCPRRPSSAACCWGRRAGCPAAR